MQKVRNSILKCYQVNWIIAVFLTWKKMNNKNNLFMNWTTFQPDNKSHLHCSHCMFLIKKGS